MIKSITTHKIKDKINNMFNRTFFYEARCLEEERGMQPFWNFHINIINESIDDIKKYFRTYSFIDIEHVDEVCDQYGCVKGNMTLVVPDDETRLVFEILVDMEFTDSKSI